MIIESIQLFSIMPVDTGSRMISQCFKRPQKFLKTFYRFQNTIYNLRCLKHDNNYKHPGYICNTGPQRINRYNLTWGEITILIYYIQLYVQMAKPPLNKPHNQHYPLGCHEKNGSLILYVHFHTVDLSHQYISVFPLDRVIYPVECYKTTLIFIIMVF